MRFLLRSYSICRNKGHVYAEKSQRMLCKQIPFVNQYCYLNDTPFSNQACNMSTMSMVSTDSAIFKGKVDRYKCVAVHSNIEPCPADVLSKKLEASMEEWTQNELRGIWFFVYSAESDWVPVLIKKGFRYHHAKEDIAAMYLWISPEQCNIPPYAHHMIGVGAIVSKDDKQILVVREKNFLFPSWKLPGGYAEPGENIVDAAIREVCEETNINTEFETVVSFRHAHHGNFNCSDIYFVVGLKPLTEEITKCDQEIEKASWMDYEEYLNHPEVHELNRMFLTKYLEYKAKNIKIDCQHGIHQKLKKSYTAYFVTSTAEDEL